ncbi:MAG: glycoside hydrolase family 9 protein, partial [Kiritimatiellae bacterium]|nr:glycoside hydrolase family 9 protein [Kiritimatiellia bacterium]
AATLAATLATAQFAADLPLDLKPLALEVYGVRGAVAIDSNTVVAVLGASATGARGKASAWRVRSEEDPDYAYESFVEPVSARAYPPRVEFPLPPGFSSAKAAKNELNRYVVELKLPRPLKPGVRYGLVAHGDGAPTTGGKTGCFFVWAGPAEKGGLEVWKSGSLEAKGLNLQTSKPQNITSVAASASEVHVPGDEIAARMVGLRRVSPLGDGKVALEFGASFSLSEWRDPSRYHVRLNGADVPIAEFGRRSKIDVYLPVGWPFRTIMQHDVFLDLGRDLKKGDRVEVSVDPAICSGERSASFVFDPATTITRSIQANQVGYLPDGPKVAYLGFWLGSFPETVKKAEKFDYTTPPTAAEAYFVPPAENGTAPLPLTTSILMSDTTQSLTTHHLPLTTSYDDLAPWAVRFHEPPQFELVNEADGSVAFTGVARLIQNGRFNDGKVNHSGENVYELDFTKFAGSGRFHLRVPGVGRSIAFDIAPDVYSRAFRVQASGVFAQRCGIELTPDRAPGWRRIACHTNGVQLSTVEHWRHREFGPFRENPVPAPNPAYPALAAAHEKLLGDKALEARFPLEGNAKNTVAGSSVTLSPLPAKKGGGCGWADDAMFRAKVMRTGERDNGFSGTYQLDPAKGATISFWLRRDDKDGNKYDGDIFRLGGDKGRALALDALWGVIRLGGKQWRRIGDNKWRHMAIRLSPAGDDGKMHAALFADGKDVISLQVPPPETSEFYLARVRNDSAAGCHFSDLRFYARPLAEDELGLLATRAEPTIPTVIPLRGGHHDAGDYNPRSHIDVAQTLFSVWEHAPAKFGDGQLDIPESGNGLPDIVDEALWALRPWYALQDEDGGVRAGTESAGDPNFYQTVELDPTGDFAYAKDSKASFIFAGTFAQASRVLAAYGRKDEAADCLAHARRAYAWAVANVPEGLSSLRQYTEYRLELRAYAAAELLHTTGEEAFLRDFRECSPWGAYADAPVRAEGRYDAMQAAYAFLRDPAAKTRDAALYERVRAAVVREADWYIDYSGKMAYKFVRHPDAPISWGTGAYGVHIRPVVAAWFATGDVKYRDWIIRTCDGMLGANPLGLSWIVGLGERTIRAPLHNSRYRPEGVVVDGMQGEGPSSRGQGYNYQETVYPAHNREF